MLFKKFLATDRFASKISFVLLCLFVFQLFVSKADPARLKTDELQLDAYIHHKLSVTPAFFFFLSKMSKALMYVAVVGKGLVGAEFVDQLLSLPVPSNPFNIVSISSSKKTWLRPKSISKTEWRKDFESSASGDSDTVTLLKGPLGSELETFVKTGHKVVLVDNTSSDTIAQLYPRFLSAGINVITPNKKAFSSDLSLYEEILTAGMASGAKFYNESTVGAGLPVISTLKDLVTTGDNVSGTSIPRDPMKRIYQVTKIEGVFSGTMSYIFNNFSTSNKDGPSFSSVVTKARELGFTVSVCFPLRLLETY